MYFYYLGNVQGSSVNHPLCHFVLQVESILNPYSQNINDPHNRYLIYKTETIILLHCLLTLPITENILPVVKQFSLNHKKLPVSDEDTGDYNLIKGLAQRSISFALGYLLSNLSLASVSHLILDAYV